MYFVVGANMPDSELFELISENKSMSKTLAEYEGGIGCNYYGSFPKLSSEIFYLICTPPPLESCRKISILVEKIFLEKLKRL